MSERPERARLPELLSPAGSPEALRAAVEAGEIARSRYDSYVSLYNETKQRKPWD